MWSTRFDLSPVPPEDDIDSESSDDEPELPVRTYHLACVHILNPDCVILGSYVHDITENRDALDEMVFHVPMRYIHIAEVDILAGYHMLIEIPILMDLSDGIFGLNREVGFTHCCVLRWIVAYDRAELYELEPIELQFEPECAFH